MFIVPLGKKVNLWAADVSDDGLAVVVAVMATAMGMRIYSLHRMIARIKVCADEVQKGKKNQMEGLRLCFCNRGGRR